MANNQTDTDPSTPSSRAEQAPQAPVTPMRIVAVKGTNLAADTDPAPPQAKTDPGLAPPPGSTPPPPRENAKLPGITVPPALAKNDSVDMLLEGFGGDQPALKKTSPDSAGKAAAAYHTKHQLHRGQETPVPEDKVIVDVPPQSKTPTVRVNRAQLEQAAAQAGIVLPRGAAAGAEPTVVLPKAQGPRIVVALFAAILVTFAIFVALKMWSVKEKQDAMATDPTASQFVIPPNTRPAVTANATTPTATTTTTTTTTAIETPALPPTAPSPTPIASPSPTTTAKAPAPRMTGTSDIPNPFAPGATKGTAAPTATAPPGPPPKTDVKRNLPE